MSSLRDNSARAKLIISIFWIMLGLAIVNMASLAWQYFLLVDVHAYPESIDMQKLRMSDTLRTIITIVQFIVLILSMIFFIMWFRRAYYNLHELSHGYARHTEGWAAGAWFIPILNLFWPYQIMEDIWKGTQNALRERLGEPRPVTLVGFWWALYLFNNVFGYVVVFANKENGDINDLMVSSQIEFVGEIISIIAILVTIIMIQRTSNFEKELLVHAETPSDSIFSDNYVPPTEESNYTDIKTQNL